MKSKRLLRVTYCLVFSALVLALAALVSRPTPLYSGDYTLVSENFVEEIGEHYGLDSSTFFSANREIGQIPGRLEEPDHSLDRSFCFVLADYHWKNSGTLYYVDQGGVRPVSEQVYDYVTADRPIAAYILREDGADIGTLYLYNQQTGKVRRLADSVNFLNCRYRLAISPSGDAVAYCRDNGDGSVTAMIWQDGNTTELGLHCYPLALSDGAEYVYYSRTDRPVSAARYHQQLLPYAEETFCVYSEAGHRELFRSDDPMQAGRFQFNRDLSEALYSVGHESYFCREGGEPELLSHGRSPQLISTVPNLAQDSGSRHTRYGLATFVGECFTSRYEEWLPVENGTDEPEHYLAEYIWRIEESGNSILFELESDSAIALADVQCSSSGAFFLHFQRALYYAKSAEALQAGSLKRLVSDIVHSYQFCISPDFQALYYIQNGDETNTLYYLRPLSGEEPAAVCENAMLGSSARLIDDTLYFTQAFYNSPSDAGIRQRLYSLTPSESLTPRALSIAIPDTALSWSLHFPLPGQGALCLLNWQESDRDEYRLYSLSNNQLTELYSKTIPLPENHIRTVTPAAP